MPLAPGNDRGKNLIADLEAADQIKYREAGLLPLNCVVLSTIPRDHHTGFTVLGYAAGDGRPSLRADSFARVFPGVVPPRYPDHSAVDEDAKGIWVRRKNVTAVTRVQDASTAW